MDKRNYSKDLRILGERSTGELLINGRKGEQHGMGDHPESRGSMVDQIQGTKADDECDREASLQLKCRFDIRL